MIESGTSEEERHKNLEKNNMGGKSNKLENDFEKMTASVKLQRINQITTIDQILVN